MKQFLPPGKLVVDLFLHLTGVEKIISFADMALTSKLQILLVQVVSYYTFLCPARAIGTHSDSP